MTLVIDNYDSFTYNLVQMLEALTDDVVVCRNDAMTADRIAGLAPRRIVLSPGPCTPADAGITTEIVRRLGPTTPILGVCLGHQAIGAAYGAAVVRADRPVHGIVSAVAHRGDGLFRGLPSPAYMTRYNSLTLDPASIPDCLEVVAWTDEPGRDDEIQGVRHRTHPVWGVQFHPESIASQGGDRLLRNFAEVPA